MSFFTPFMGGFSWLSQQCKFSFFSLFFLITIQDKIFYCPRPHIRVINPWIDFVDVVIKAHCYSGFKKSHSNSRSDKITADKQDVYGSESQRPCNPPLIYSTPSLPPHQRLDEIYSWTQSIKGTLLAPRSNHVVSLLLETLRSEIKKCSKARGGLST